jgi:5-oxoprolinase (ATP-hydrolysing)
MADGTVLMPLDQAGARRDLQAAYDAGLRACAIVFMHGYRYVDHERVVTEIARDIGFDQVSTSHAVSPPTSTAGATTTARAPG